MDTTTEAGTTGQTAEITVAEITVAEITDAFIRADTDSQLSLNGWNTKLGKTVEVKPGEHGSITHLHIQSREGRLEHPGRTDIGFSGVHPFITVYLGTLVQMPPYCFPIIKRANEILEDRLYAVFDSGIRKGDYGKAQLLARRLKSGR